MIALAQIFDRPLDVAAHMDAVAADAQGATALFVGTVRDNDPDAAGRVTRLDYSAHPDAEAVLRELAGRHDEDGIRLAVSHRVGSLEIGDAAICCAVSSVHREAAFAVCRDLVESVKAELPVWKRQLEEDGSHTWVGLGRLV